MTMMVVDDDSLVTTLMHLSLRELGFERVIAESTGAAALAQLDAGLKPGVIFCDLQMPGMDGVQLLRHLGNRNYRGGVILLSGSDWRILKSCEEMGTALGLHMLGILQKPFDSSSILQLLENAHSMCAATPPRGAPVNAADLLLALEQGLIEAWFQPQLETATLRPFGAEVLARWRQAECGFVSPLAFITLAEECGLINRLMQVIFSAALSAMRTLRDAGSALRFSINLSAYNLHDLTLPEQLEALCLEAGFRPSDVMIEITESGVAQSRPMAQEIQSRLRLKGFGLSIADYGTGYSSMEKLHRLPFTELKIDKAFVRGCTTDPRSHAMFESSVLLARKLRLVSVAEGIETEEDLAVATALGCDMVQGFLFAEAMPVAELLTWLAQHPASAQQPC